MRVLRRACQTSAVTDTAEPADRDPQMRRVVGILRGLVDVDVPPDAPPANLWDRISAAVAAEIDPDPSTLRAGGPATVIEYRIDSNDVVVSVGADWDAFARQNEGDELADTPTGRTLWSTIGDDSLRDLWREAVGRVRSTGTPVTVPFRCDGPSARRWFEMTMTPLEHGAVGFRSRLVVEMPRPELAVLRREVPRDPDATGIEVCSWCNAANDRGEWRPVEEALANNRLLEQDPPPPVVHGLCPQCVDSMSAQLTGTTT